MKFKIEASSVRWDGYEMLSKYPALTNFGYKVEEVTKIRNIPIRDEDNKRIFQPTPTIIKTPYITIDSLEQLIELHKVVDESLIITSDSIEIYDSYRE